jgi:predicted nucleotidyltransferase component of viral defense system
VPFEEQYRRQVALLLRAIPLVAEEGCFAVKGGTAINLFVRDMPRLSIDIDLTYLPVQPRDKSLKAIDAAMTRISERTVKAIPGARVTPSRAEGAILKLLLRSDRAQIKIEVTPVLRGCVYEPELRTVSPAVEEAFGFAEMKVVSLPDLYAGKIVAALDRQHPRDLFDVRELLANEGISEDLRRAFIVYLLSHGRPMSEVLTPKRKPIHEEFLRGFEGMTDRSVSLEELVAAREDLIKAIVGGMPKNHRAFLLSFKRGTPEWPLLGVPEAASLPAVQWRQHNLDKLAKDKRDALVKRLAEVLGE